MYMISMLFIISNFDKNFLKIIAQKKEFLKNILDAKLTINVWLLKNFFIKWLASRILAVFYCYIFI